MKRAGERPDGVTFVGILSACTHMGLVRNGLLHFQSMVDDYSIVPQIEHYGCMVDLLGRAGLIDQAVDIVRKMPMEPDVVIWAALLGACRCTRMWKWQSWRFNGSLNLNPTTLQTLSCFQTYTRILEDGKMLPD